MIAATVGIHIVLITGIVLLAVIALAGWLNRHQQVVIDYLVEENRVLKNQLEGQSTAEPAILTGRR